MPTVFLLAGCQSCNREEVDGSSLTLTAGLTLGTGEQKDNDDTTRLVAPLLMTHPGMSRPPPPHPYLQYCAAVVLSPAAGRVAGRVRSVDVSTSVDSCRPRAPCHVTTTRDAPPANTCRLTAVRFTEKTPNTRFKFDSKKRRTSPTHADNR